MKHKGNVVTRIAFTFMMFALAVAMVACEAAAGKPGEAGKAGEPGEPGGVPPSVDEAIGDVSLAASGSMATMTIDLNDHFYDPDGEAGEALTYAASSSDTNTATASVSGSILTLTAVAVGTARITVRATDVDGLSSGSARFDVTVAETVAPQKTAIPDQVLYQADGAKTIDLATYFTHERAITYTASALPVGFVTVAISAEGVLTLTPLVTGQTIVTVTATADEMSASDDFVVDVMAGSEPTPVEPPSGPPTAVGTIPAVTVEVGMSTDVDVAAYFSDTQALSYSSMSSDTAKATANVVSGSSTVKITGAATGTVTVTVTATDPDDNSIDQEIAVTVTAATAPYKPSSVTIAGVAQTADISIDADQNLASLNPNIVTVSRKSDSTTVWTLTGVKKGTATVRIWNVDRNTIDQTVSVTVENSAPMIVTAMVPKTRLTTGTGLVTKSGVANTDPTTVSETNRAYHLVTVAVGSIFEDADRDTLSYEAKSNDPYIKVVDVVVTTDSATTGIVIDVMKDVGYSFPLELYAMDGTLKSETVLLTAESPTPHADSYMVNQNREEGAFDPARIWRREGVNHTLTFNDYDTGVTDSAFNFVRAFLDGLGADENELPDGGVTGIRLNPDAPGDADAATTPAPYYTVSTTGPVKMVTLATDQFSSGESPSFTFQLDGAGMTGTVTITYYVVVDTDGDATNTATDREWRSTSQTLTMNIVPSSS